MASTAIRTAKKAFRIEIKKMLEAMTSEEKAKQSKLVIEKVRSHQRFKGSQRISIFVSTDKEVDTKPIIESIFETGKDCFIPRYDPKSRKMDMVRLHTMKDLETLPLSSWKIQQPLEDDPREEALSSGGLDLMIVPGLAFTRSGQRIGQGRGYFDFYFDRCLNDPHGRPYTIGLAFDQQIFRSVPTDEHDVKIDEVIYPGYEG